MTIFQQFKEKKIVLANKRNKNTRIYGLNTRDRKRYNAFEALDLCKMENKHLNVQFILEKQMYKTNKMKMTIQAG